MARSNVRPSSDWLRPTRPLIRGARPDFCPNITNPDQRDLFWGTVLSMVVGGLLGLAVVLGLAA